MYSIFSCACILCSHFVSIFFVPVNPDKKNQVVWFGTHAIVNFTISWYTFMSVYYTFSNPQKSGDFEYQKQLGISKFPMCLSIWIHIYHAVFYNLSQEDMFHHTVFVTLLPVPGYIYDWGIISNCNLFFICGLPGGLIYTLLTLQKCGYLLKWNEPYLSMVINTTIRCPGILASSIILFFHMYNNRLNVPIQFIIIQLLLCPINAIYYSRQSIKRYHKNNNWRNQ